MIRPSSWLIGLTTAWMACHAMGATLTVLNANDSGPGSLRATIAAAQDGDTIVFDSSLNGQTITLTSGDIVITKPLTIAGPGADQLTLSGNNASRIFTVNPAGSVLPQLSLSGVTLAQGNGLGSVQTNYNYYGGAIFTYVGPVTLTDCEFRFNTATDGNHVGIGGAVFGLVPLSLTINRCTFADNFAMDGGAVGTFLGRFSVNDSFFSSNSASWSGGAMSFLNATGAVNRCTFERNYSVDNGGAIFLDAVATIHQCTFFQNRSAGAGGALLLNGFYTTLAEVLHCTFAGNSSEPAGRPASTIYHLGTLRLGATILAGDGFTPNYYFVPGPDTVLDICGTVLSDDNSLTGPNVINAPAGLDPNGLQDNGGPTPTIALMPDSPAIDAATTLCAPPPQFDQRGPGYLRLVGAAVDLGAYEVQGQPELPPRLAKIAVRDELLVLRNQATSKDRSKFDAAISYLNKSLEAKRWLDDSHLKKGPDGEGVFNNEKSAVSQLLPLVSKYAGVQEQIDRLVQIDRKLAEIAINEAIARGGNASKINAALSYLQKGDADAAAGKPTYAIDDYKNAWKNAVAA